MRLFFVFFSFLLLAGCASQSKHTNFNKNFSTRSKVKNYSHFLSRSVQKNKPVTALKNKSKVISASQVAVDSKVKESKPFQPDQALYSELLASYDRRDKEIFEKSFDLLTRLYPQSVHADNAYFLKGKWALNDMNYKEALKNFEVVITKYPDSNKVVSAMYAKAMTFKMMNLTSQAEDLFAKTKKTYPGSLEANRSDLQLKIIEKGRIQ